MSNFTVDTSHFSMSGAYYPRGFAWAMFKDLPTAQAASEKVAALPGVGAVTVASAEDIGRNFAKRSEDVGGMPSVGREDQFMLRYVELAEQGKAGLLIEVADADSAALADVLRQGGAVLAYHYRRLVIEELAEPSTGAEAAAAGEL